MRRKRRNLLRAIPNDCPLGYMRSGHNCYKKFERRVTWDVAALTCASDGGRLASLNTEGSFRFIQQLLGKMERGRFWIAGKLSDKAGAQSSDYDYQLKVPKIAFEMTQVERKESEANLRCFSLFKKERRDPTYTISLGRCRTRHFFVCELDTQPKETTWTEWYSDDTPDGRGDIEGLQSLRRGHPEICGFPTEVECRVKGTEEGWKASGQKLMRECAIGMHGGLICLNKDNTDQCKDYEVRFKCPADVNECSLGIHDCNDKSACVNTHGHYICMCNEGTHWDGEACQGGGSCTAWGDPHYKTFDGQKHDFMGKCKYILATPCEKFVEVTPFTVEVDNEVRNKKQGVTFTKSVEVSLFKHKFKLLKDKVISVDGETYSLPFDFNGKVHISFSGNNMLLKTNFGLRVSFDGLSRAQVTVPDDYKGKMCGICGDFDGNKDNDFMTPGGKMLEKTSNKRLDSMLYGSSWEAKDSPKRCTEPEKPLDNCKDADMEKFQAADSCGMMIDSAGPFASCNDKIDAVDFFDSCTFDMCEYEGSPSILCTNLQSYAEQCNDAGVMEIDWRTDTNCPETCMEFATYQSAVSACPATCIEQNAPQSCQDPPVEGCICDEGYVLSGQHCVPQEECGCIFFGRYMEADSRWMSHDCTRNYTCVAGGLVLENKVGCHDDALCTVIDHERTCYCKKGFIGDGIENCRPDSNKCPAGFAQFRYKCYRRGTKPQVWDVAALTCAALGGRLALPNSKGEREHMWKLMGKDGPHWLSGKTLNIKKKKPNQYGQNMKVIKMAKRKRKRTKGTKCFAFSRAQRKKRKRKSFSMNFEDCSKKKPYICEIDKDPKDFHWSKWCSQDTPDGQGDIETFQRLRMQCKDICPYPTEIQCRSKTSKKSWDKTGQFLLRRCKLGLSGGIVCQNAQQSPGKCDDYEVRYKCTPDVDECKQGTHDCPKDRSTCVNTHGHYFCKCKSGYIWDERRRTCDRGATCIAWGDPHYLTFDKQRHDFMGICKYTMAEPCKDFGSMPNFTVAVQNERRYNRDKVSFAKYVDIHVYQRHIVLGKGLQITMDDISVSLPLAVSEKIQIKRSGQKAVLTTDFGLRVTFDGRSRAEVNVPPPYQKHMCGICGDYDGNKDNDYRMPNGELANTEGSQVLNSLAFGDSWQRKDGDQPLCKPVPPPPDCAANKKGKPYVANNWCGLLTDTTGPFSSCFSVVDNAEFFDSCVFDVCTYDGDQDLLCTSLQNYADQCYEAGMTKIHWRKADFCPMECPPNSHYSEDAPGCPATCSDPAAADTCQEQSVEGCVCDEGLILSDQKCIQPPLCGCEYMGSYHVVGDIWMEGQCEKRLVCNEGGVLVSEDTKCVKNAECVIENCAKTCKCKSSYEGDGFVGCSLAGACDPATDDRCVKNANCTLVSGEVICKCDMGYIADCEQCVDLNECMFGMDNCRKNEKCVNDVGSFHCECADGFKKSDNNKCKDINECKHYNGQCPMHSECRNLLGSSECICCAGYKMSGDKCELIAEKEPIRCCACTNYHECQRPGKVCGSDMKTYDSLRDLMESACLSGSEIKMIQDGECQNGCDMVSCGPFQECVVDKNSGNPVCVCIQCTDGTKASGPVCSSSGDSYLNECAFQMATCKLGRDYFVVHTGACIGSGATYALTTEWSAWSDCSQTCGVGQRTQYRDLISGVQSGEVTPILTVSQECYNGPCPLTSCLTFDCHSRTEICVMEEEQPVCRCPSCTGAEFSPVCAEVGGRIRSYDNVCTARAAACRMHVDYDVITNAKCKNPVLNCSVTPLEIKYKNAEGCVSINKVNLRTCGGVCGMVPGICCQPTLTTRKQVEMQCNNRVKSESVQIVEECGCLADNHEESFPE